MPQAHLIQNYPGFDEITGIDLAQKMKNHYLGLNGSIYEKTIINIEKQKDEFIINTDINEKIKAKTIIISTGTKRRKLNVDGEDKFLGRGISYCATCDAPFFKNKTVGVIGGGNSAFSAALHLSKFATKVYLIHRRSEFKADPIEISSVKSQNNVELILDTVINKIGGDVKVKFVDLENVKTNETKQLLVDGVFIEAGSIPIVNVLGNIKVDLDENGYIKVNDDMSTNFPGLFAAGDCTNAMNNLKQIVTAVAMGAIASESAYKLVNKS
jgi:thioredoxin reductase (NADPH)